MKSPQQRIKPWHVQGLTLLLLGVLGALYFLVYIPTRTDELIERDFRMLGDMGSQVSEAVVNAYNALANASTFLEPARGADTNSFQAAVEMIRPHLEVPPVPAASEWNGTVALEITCNREVLVHWPYGTSATNALSTNSLIATLDAGELLSPILERYPFSDILLVQTNGNVLFQFSQSIERTTNATAGADLRLNTLAKFGEGGDTNLSARGTLLVERIQIAGKAYKLFAQPLVFRIGGRAEDRIQWWICGLTRTKEFTTQTWAIPTTTSIAFAFIALAVVLLWPFLDIAFCGPTGTVRRLEVGWVLAGSFCGCAALVFVLLYANAYLFSERESDEQVERLACNVQTNVLQEFRKVDRLLADLERMLADDANLVCDGVVSNGWSQLTSRTNVFQDRRLTNNYPILEVFWVGSNESQVFKWTPQTTATALVPVRERAYFRSLREGWAWHWAEQAPLLSCLSSADTNLFYVESVFSKTRGENIAALSRPFSATNWPTTNRAGGGLISRPSVGVITFQPLSLFSPHLPAGYGFCIIEPNGRVLFHSDGRRNLRENFITESCHDAGLQAAVYARSQNNFDLRYLSQTHHLSILPVRGLPWTIVAFRNEHLLDSVHRNILLTAAVLFGVYVASQFGFLALGWLLRRPLRGGGGRPRGWFWRLWPSGPSNERYPVHVTLMVLGILGYLAGVVSWRAPDRLMLWLLVVPAIFSAAICLPPFAGARAKRWSKPIGVLVLQRGALRWFAGAVSRVATHRAYLGLLLVFFAMVPALGCYRIAFLKEMECYLKGTQLKLARELQQRPTQTRGRAVKRAGADTNYWASARQNRLTSSWNRYVAFFWDSRVRSLPVDPVATRGSAPEREWFTEFYEACRPRFNETGLGTGALLSTHAGDHSWHSQFDRTRGTLTLTLEGGNDLNEPGAIEMTSQVPGLGWLELAPFHRSTAWSWCWYFGLLAALGVPFFFARFISRTIFLDRLPDSLRYRTVSRNVRFVSPARGLAHGQPEPFAAVEMTRVVLSQDSCQWAEAEDGAVLVPLKWNPDQVADKAQELRESRSRTAIAVFAAGEQTEVSSSPGEPAPGALPKAHERFWEVTPADPGSSPTRDPREQAALSLSLHYGAQWRRCTAREKLTLYQVAQVGFTSPARPELRTLLDRELLRFGPELVLRNESLRRFVLTSFRADEIAQELPAEEPERLFSWRSLRAPLGIAISAGAMFLFATQQELWQLAVGLATSFATAADRWSRITGLFQETKTDGEQSADG